MSIVYSNYWWFNSIVVKFIPDEKMREASSGGGLANFSEEQRIIRAYSCARDRFCANWKVDEKRNSEIGGKRGKGGTNR